MWAQKWIQHWIMLSRGLQYFSLVFISCLIIRRCLAIDLETWQLQRPNDAKRTAYMAALSFATNLLQGWSVVSLEYICILHTHTYIYIYVYIISLSLSLSGTFLPIWRKLSGSAIDINPPCREPTTAISRSELLAWTWPLLTVADYQQLPTLENPSSLSRDVLAG